ncbi:hypothetical protein K040078D81_44270 [Blautia hominis]|uniref:Flagellar export protein FliJ n=1 Tax=Blautia hominis TaxID=2025493 RepID=A0ABQ0BFS1_9FIRM
MPRGRKKTPNFTLEEQLSDVQAEIDNHTEALRELKAKKKEIQEKMTEKEKEEVYQAFLKSGKSIEDVIATLLENNSGEQEETE